MQVAFKHYNQRLAILVMNWMYLTTWLQGPLDSRQRTFPGLCKLRERRRNIISNTIPSALMPALSNSKKNVGSLGQESSTIDYLDQTLQYDLSSLCWNILQFTSDFISPTFLSYHEEYKYVGDEQTSGNTSFWCLEGD